MMFLGPIARKADLFKQLRSPARDRALAGIKNAAWDMTHLSDFSKRVQDSLISDRSRRFIFATDSVRQDGVISGVAPGCHDQAALGVI